MAAILQVAACFLTTAAAGQTLPLAQQGVSYEQDFSFYWQTVYDNFAYFDGEQRKRADWERVRELYAAKAKRVGDRAGLIRLLEAVNNELFNGHVTLNANLRSSNRIIPTGADIWAERVNNRYVITAVREDFNAARVGLRSGMVLASFDEAPI